jgi:hypothetical protein
MYYWAGHVQVLQLFFNDAVAKSVDAFFSFETLLLMCMTNFMMVSDLCVRAFGWPGISLFSLFYGIYFNYALLLESTER